MCEVRMGNVGDAPRKYGQSGNPGNLAIQAIQAIEFGGWPVVVAPPVCQFGVVCWHGGGVQIIIINNDKKKYKRMKI